MRPNFEWDEAKTAANVRKHGITFDEAATVLIDPYSMTIPDPEHSSVEDRYLSIGVSDRGRILVVSFVERQMNIRIISCRKATQRERRLYEEGE